MNIKSIIDGSKRDLFSFQTNADEEELLIKILNKIHINGPVDPADFEKLALLKKFQLEIFQKHEAKLISLIGLFFKTKNPESLIEEIYSVYASAIREEFGGYTPVQADVSKKISYKKYFSFSAPTSIGKSYLFKDLIKKSDNDVVIVAPTRSLIFEYRNTLDEITDKSELVMEFIEIVNTKHTKKRIFVITPERGAELFKNQNLMELQNIKLFLFDEAQMSEEEGVRGIRFDAFVRRVDKIFPDAKKVFTHPFIENPEAQLKKHRFEIECSGSKKYQQHSVGKIYLSVNKQKKFNYFSPFTNERNIGADEDIVKEIIQNDGTILIYVSKDKIYQGKFGKEFSRYINLCPELKNPEALKYIAKLEEFIGSNSDDKNSTMISMMKKGIVFHHGSMPLKARFLIEEFVNKNFAKICFSTSTLTQGINMPFHAVWVNNYTFRGSEAQKILSLKNLIGRSGRISETKNYFDYGYVIIEEKNVDGFCKRINDVAEISETSKLDSDISEVPEEMMDEVDAIKNDSFNDELQLTNAQVNRLKEADNSKDIEFILDRIMIDGKPIRVPDYYEKSDREEIRNSFKRIFVSHLRRGELTKRESAILSTSIPILLWQIEGKSFSEIISLRHAFLSKKDERRKIEKRLKEGELTQKEADKELKKLRIKWSALPESIPIPSRSKKSLESSEEEKKKVANPGLYAFNASVDKIKYDRLVFDTYDYIDKVISLSLKDPMSAAFLLYFEKTGDVRAKILSNYIKYGTNDDKEIWLIKYGFSFDEIEWLTELVTSINKEEIIFKTDLGDIGEEKLQIIKRFRN